MKALLMTDFNQLKIVEMDVPKIEQPDGVLMKVRSSGICGSDLHGYTGYSGRRQPPLVMGHEVAAEVVQVGSQVTHLQPGDLVALNPTTSCGICGPCLAGHRSICENRLILGMSAPGAYAEYLTWPAANVIKLPDGLSPETAALAEPVSIAQHAVALAHFRPYDHAFIVGAGPIGLLTLAILANMGLSSIGVSDLSDSRLQTALDIGAGYVVNPQKEDVLQVVQKETGQSGVDVSFEAVGLSSTSQQTLEVTRNRGTVIWLGNNQRMIEIDMQAIVTRELRVLGSYGMSNQEFRRSLQMLADDLIPTELIINRRAELDEGPELFDVLLRSPEVIKCVFNF